MTRLLICLPLLWPAVATAQPVTLLSGDTARQAFIALDGPRSAASAEAGSLFIGRDGQSFFRPWPVRIEPRTGRVQLGLNDGAVARLRDLIALAEAGAAGYDAVQHGARIGTPRRPSTMTLGEIYAWIAATPGQPHAIGRYQFIPPTLRRTAAKLGLGPETVFDARTQDRLANVLLAEAGLNAMLDGQISRRTFMANLAKVWAGLPKPNGLSHYHGYAGNKATISWALFDGTMARIFPAAR